MEMENTNSKLGNWNLVKPGTEGFPHGSLGSGHLEYQGSKESAEHDNPPPAWAIRRGDWKLIQIVENGPPMLFNIAADPSESKDMFQEKPEIAAELQKAWLKWFPICGTPIAWKPEYFQ